MGKYNSYWWYAGHHYLRLIFLTVKLAYNAAEVRSLPVTLPNNGSAEGNRTYRCTSTLAEKGLAPRLEIPGQSARSRRR